MSIRTAFREAFPGRPVRAARKMQNSRRAGSIHFWRPFFMRRDSTGGNATSLAEAIADIERIRRFPNIGMALGNHIYVDWIDGWRKESDPIGVNVNWVHTKFMLIDPLGNQPITLTGSANFSEASVNTNDENMVLIRGDKRVADIYFGEFMRVFAQHQLRVSVSSISHGLIQRCSIHGSRRICLNTGGSGCRGSLGRDRRMRLSGGILCGDVP